MKKWILLLVLSCFPSKSYSQNVIDTIEFSKVAKSIDLEQSLLVIGEAHEVKGTYQTELYLLEQFLQKSTKTIILEAGISEVEIFKEYFLTGDERLLENTRARSENYRRFIDGLKNLSEKYKFDLLGVDFERSVCLEYVLKKWLLNIENEALDDLKNTLLSINQTTSSKKVKKIFLRLRNEFNLYEYELQKELGENASKIKAIVFNPVFQADFGLSSKKRDEQILENLFSIPLENLENSVLIFGSNHFTNEKHFGSKFGNELHGELTCTYFMFAYKNCTNYLRKGFYDSGKPLSNFMSYSDASGPNISFRLHSYKTIAPLAKDHQFVLVELSNL